MATERFHLLTFDAYGDAIGQAATVLRANATATPLDGPVPTCPGWTLRDLVSHAGMVHRWASDQLRAGPGADPAAHQDEGRASADLLTWFDTGATALLQSLVDAPDDLDALVFLADAPPAKIFWARRQAHETTIHAVDALAARLGRAPTSEETWIRGGLALDGIDEILAGFVARGGRRAVHTPEPTTLLVHPDGSGVAWHVSFSPDAPAVTRRMDTSATHAASVGSVEADHVLTGPAVAAYLTLWNRSDDTWREQAWWREVLTVTWA
ncbi:MAG: maleylpyruvate isomerase N-terminal domain-containing protein [Intrasporangium sp.]|uniref:maleylpyruvate isomerase N-terminal domain-containing protein n=1 Tax=Intrasporangium sp. TaxID=1925024 RepID=UPI0026493698|nr:maleylpyruvate isomerase N-terminal domain-containing protein [Intrasporangium sp.]MDN5797300.1 maleylpyruvate isomerase N-terminal domain-containing protein [Intrasporangium sp.]